jgi:hypothetical protein
MFIIESIENIKVKLLDKNIQTNNFSKSITFPFDELYKEIVTKIKTTEISSECILYNSVEASNMTKIYSEDDYWNENVDKNNIKNYWFIGQNGQGDYWIMDKDGEIYFYDHNNE